MSSEIKVLLAGPWVGEFGWELFCWQAYVRKMSRNFDKTIIVSRPGHKYLYEDFCSEYIEFDPRSYKTDVWKCFEGESFVDIIPTISHSYHLDGNFDIIKKLKSDNKNSFLEEQEFIQYNYRNNKNFDIIFHCRNKSTGADRNWERSSWEKLYMSLPKNLKIACIGNNEAFHIQGTVDMRGIEIKELVGTINNSKLLIGPSSGPMHLASLCGKNHLVWSAEYNRKRYEKNWNPFNTKVVFYSEGGWNPDFREINKLILANI